MIELGVAPLLRVPRPRVETIRRSVPGQLTVGDFGIALTTTALIDCINSLQNAGVSEVSGYSLGHSIPFQLSGAVADALLAPTRTFFDAGWAAYRVDVFWSAIPKPNEQILSRTQADHVSENLVRFSTTASSSQQHCVSGQIQYVRVQNGMNLATNHAIAEPLKVDPNKSGNPDSRHYTPFLVSLLMNPIAGGKEPLGRRLHPLGSVPLAALVFQALRHYPDKSVISASLKYFSPMRTDIGFTATTERKQEDSVSIVLTDDVGVRFALGKATVG